MSAVNEDPAGVRNLTSARYPVCASTEGGLDSLPSSEGGMPENMDGEHFKTTPASGHDLTRPGRD